MEYGTSSSDAAMAFIAIFALLVWVFSIIIGLVVLISTWKLYEKADKPGWAAIIPIYNVIVMLEIIRRPIWWLIMFFVPFVNIVFSVMMTVDFVKAYGKDTTYGVLSILFPFVTFPMLAFSKNVVYTTPTGEGRVDTLGTPPPTPAQ